MGVFLVEVTLLKPIETWFNTREVMQNFGINRQLQLQKIEEVSSISARIGEICADIFSWDKQQRPTAGDLVEQLADDQMLAFLELVDDVNL